MDDQFVSSDIPDTFPKLLGRDVYSMIARLHEIPEFFTRVFYAWLTLSNAFLSIFP